MRMVLTLNLGVEMCGFHDIYVKHKCIYPAILFFLPVFRVAWRVGEESGNFAPYWGSIGGPLEQKMGT